MDVGIFASECPGFFIGTIGPLHQSAVYQALLIAQHSDPQSIIGSLKTVYRWFARAAGQKVVSQQIAVEAMEEVSRIVQRKVTIWDNLHANDYDQTRLYLGPYSGRDARIIGHTRGVLTNPNCEFEVNFVALHTLAQWSIDRNTRFTATAAGREFYCR